MGLFKKRVDVEELERVKAELAALKQQLESQATSAGTVDARLESITAEHDRLTEQLAGMDAVSGRLADLDARVTAVSTELANQISELGSDIDAAAAAGGDGTGAAQVTELREGQVRLAGEQARYQIAFREDLAKLAEQIRRGRS